MRRRLPRRCAGVTLQRENSEGCDGDCRKREARERDETTAQAWHGGPRTLEIRAGEIVIGARSAGLLSTAALGELEILGRVKDAPLPVAVRTGLWLVVRLLAAVGVVVAAAQRDDLRDQLVLRLVGNVAVVVVRRFHDASLRFGLPLLYAVYVQASIGWGIWVWLMRSC